MAINWQGLRDPYQWAEEGVKCYPYYYVYQVRKGYWVAGRSWLGEDVSFRIRFSSAKVARDYCQIHDRESWENRIVGIPAESNA
jgi:hypothetical protein